MKRSQPGRLDRKPAFLTDPVEAPSETLQHLVKRSQLVPSGITDCLQGLVILQLDRPIAPVADQRFAASLQIGLYPLVALEQGVTPGQKGVLDLAKILFCNRHASLPYHDGASKMARRR